jgi:hypothetical protein
LHVTKLILETVFQAMGLFQVFELSAAAIRLWQKTWVFYPPITTWHISISRKMHKLKMKTKYQNKKQNEGRTATSGHKGGGVATLPPPGHGVASEPPRGLGWPTQPP